MYIDHVSLRNIRGFETLDFSLRRTDGSHAGWTVFTGDNGSGKSTLLKAIALGLMGAETALAFTPSPNDWVRNGSTEDSASVELSIVRATDDDHSEIINVVTSNPIFATVRVAFAEFDVVFFEEHIEFPHMQASTATAAKGTIRTQTAKAWFACGYGPFRRLSGSSAEVSSYMAAPSTAKFVTMFHESASLAEADRWLRDLQYKNLEGKAAEKKQLEILIRILNDDLMPNSLSVARVDSDGLWLIDRNGVMLAWSEMSDGYRSALALLIDIIRHLINTYGVDGLTDEGADGKLFIKRSGVVLIDEIDAHLHPEWQREIGFWLKRHFPNIQFLVTTHSPIICQAADPNGLFVLPEPGSGTAPRALSSEEYQMVISSRPDTILLSPAFGLQNTRSPLAVESRAEYAKLQAKKRAKATLTPQESDREQEIEFFANGDEAP